MLTHLILLGMFNTEIEAGTGEVIATTERTVTIAKTPNATSRASTLPLGSYPWTAHLDPSDRAPFAIDFTGLLDTGETIAEIVRLTVSATGASVGVEIDDSTDRIPIIDTDGKKIQMWFLVDEAFQANAAFAAAGVQVGIAALIRTNGDPYKDFERTAVLTVRQQ